MIRVQLTEEDVFLRGRATGAAVGAYGGLRTVPE